MVVESFNLNSYVISPAACRHPFWPRLDGAREIFRVRPDLVYPARCWSWRRCPGCAFLMSKDAKRLVLLGVERALAASLPLVLLTLTEPSEPRGYKASSSALTELMKRLQARFGGGLRWIAVVEWQKRGAVHWHVVIAGLKYTRAWTNPRGRRFPGHPKDARGVEVRKEADLRPIVERYGFGRVFNIHAVGVGVGNAAEYVAHYLSKYLTKSEDMARLPKGAQPVRSSRGRNQWAPGYTLTSLRDERRATARERAAALAVA